ELGKFPEEKPACCPYECNDSKTRRFVCSSFWVRERSHGGDVDRQCREGWNCFRQSNALWECESASADRWRHRIANSWRRKFAARVRLHGRSWEGLFDRRVEDLSAT